MKQTFKDQLLAELQKNPQIDRGNVDYLRLLFKRYDSVTRDEGNQLHVTSYFLPYNPKTKKIFMTHHIKSGLWLITGGHIDHDETPRQAAVREWHEELGEKIAEEALKGPFALTITPIANPRFQPKCSVHYDIWFYAETDGMNFTINEKELGETAWLSIPEAIERTEDGNTKKGLAEFQRVVA